MDHDVPCTPAKIRTLVDPISVISKVLQQNEGAYTKLDDLISISQNLVFAFSGPPLSHPYQAGDTEDGFDEDLRPLPVTAEEIDAQQQIAEKRVIAMAVEAALSGADFETAYSYITGRLRPSVPTTEERSSVDDISWRAALEAGSYRGHVDSTSSTFSLAGTKPAHTSQKSLRRLQQRLEMLSLALLLAPAKHAQQSDAILTDTGDSGSMKGLSDILSVYRKAEEELEALLASEMAAEEAFDDRADRHVPGGFGGSPEMVLGQPRREMGRLTGTPSGTAKPRPGVDTSAPMGLFDVAKYTASALSRNAFPLRGQAQQEAARAASGAGSIGETGRPGSAAGSVGSDGGAGGDRVRKRDLLTGAVTGGFARGVGWVIGANPAQDNEKD